MKNFLVFAPVIPSWMTRLRRRGYWPCGARVGRWKKKHGGDNSDGIDGDGADEVSSISRWHCRSFRHRRHLRTPERDHAVESARWTGIRNFAGSYGTNCQWRCREKLVQRDGEHDRHFHHRMGRGCSLRSWSLHRHGRQGGEGHTLGAPMMMQMMWVYGLGYFGSVRASLDVLEAMNSRLVGLRSLNRTALWCLCCHCREVYAADWRRDERWGFDWYHPGRNCLLRTIPPRRWI